MINELENFLIEAKIQYNVEILNKFETYKNLIQEWNTKVNITSITEDEDIYIKHFIDSIIILNYDIIKNANKIIDVGTGGGFPGIPVKIFCENTFITLLDSLNKRVIFLNEVITKLNLNKIEAIHERAEILGKNKVFREKYDIALSRAVAPLNILSEYCLPFVKKGGKFISYKSGEIQEELKSSKEAIEILGGEITNVIKFNLPKGDYSRSIIEITKLKNTPLLYPRKAGQPSKKPL